MSSTEQTPPPLHLDGHVLQSAEDVAAFFGIGMSAMIHGLYRAPESTRYHHFEIPKRTGGMRLISAPRGMVRDLQDHLNPLLQAAYDAHPSAHGFINARSVVSNASPHTQSHWVLNVDLADFFPSINFGRVRGLFMAPPFSMGHKAATVLAQICTHRNGLPQGASTSPVLSNLIAAALDRRLTRLARENKCRYSRYADDITFSTKQALFPPPLAVQDLDAGGEAKVRAGAALEEAITACGFVINAKKVRLQRRHHHQSVTGLCVNETVNVERERIRRVRAMLHAWQKFGIDAAGAHYLAKHGGRRRAGQPANGAYAFRNAVYGQLAFIKMVRGAADPVFLKLCARLIELDPNPSKFIRQMVFGANDFDIFISHASEDKSAIARPIFEACERMGLKAFLDEEHIGWGQSFTKKINTALGAARTILVVVSNSSVSKEWPLAEINTALGLEVSGQKRVVPVMVGRPDLSHLPLLRGKRWIEWQGDAQAVARQLNDFLAPGETADSRTGTASPPSVPTIPAPASQTGAPAAGLHRPPPQSWLSRIFGR